MSNNTDENYMCRLHLFEKNHYFYGKLMTVRDFETEQSYFDEKNHLINRLLHGSGLVCGFETLEIKDNGDKITVNFIDGGMALDCCGRELVVPANSLGKSIIDSGGNSVPDLTASPYLYLKYKPCYDGYVAAASNPSSCEEKCCPGRVVEDFEVVASDKKPDLKGIVCRAESSEEPGEIPGASEWLDALEKAHISCPSCEENLEYKIFLGKVETGEGGFKVNTWDTEKHRIFFTQKELYQLLKCHLLDFNNPHEVTAEQIGALKSVDGVSNPGGDVDLVSANAIVITPDDPGNKITIGETHSAIKEGNPHNVTAEQVKALVSINGIGNPGGNIDLKQGENVTITLDPAAHTIEIASKGGADPGDTVRSVSTTSSAGTSDKYSREDHVHDLEKLVVDFVNLSERLQEELNLLFMYLRERALKCTVNSFKQISGFENELPPEIVKTTREAIDNKIYTDENDFIAFIKRLLRLMTRFADSIEGQATEASLKGFRISLEELKNAIDSGDPIKVAIQQDEVCFYVLELERLID